MLFDKNSKLLKEKFPHLALELKEPGHTGVEFEVIQSKTGLPVARVIRNNRRVFLNSPYDPVSEADRWLGSLEEKKDDYLLVGGSGFLYHLKALSGRRNFKRIIVYEPCREVFLSCLHEVDWEPLLKGLDFLLVVGDAHQDNAQLLIDYLGASYFGDLKSSLGVTLLPAYRELFSGEIAAFQEKITETLRLIRVNLDTNELFAKQWLVNGLKNLNSMAGSPVIKDYFHQFSGVPAIIVSAGPSLEKNIHLLNAVKEKAVIICAGTSIRAMLHHGVRPHFLVGFDGGQVNRLVYNDLDLHDINLVYSSRFFHEIVTNYNGPKILMKNDVETFPDLLALTQGMEIGTVRSGFSVAHTCLDLAAKLGCNPIVLIGQDLAYTDNKHYAEGQVASFQNLVDNQLVIRKDFEGRDIVTSKKFESFKFVFERIIAELDPGIRVINATEGGLPITGAPNRKLDQVLAEHCQMEREISQRIRVIYERGLQDTKRRRMDFNSIALKLKTLVNQGITGMEGLIGRLQELRRVTFSEAFDRNKLLPAFQQIASAYEMVVSRREFDILLKSLRDSKLLVIKMRMAEVNMVATREEFDGILQSSLLFFSETQKYLEYIRDCMKDIVPAAVKEEQSSVSFGLNSETCRSFEGRIKRGETLNEIQRTLDRVISRGSNGDEMARALYLRGLISIRSNQLGKAVIDLEQAVALDKSLAKAYFMLFRLSQKGKDLVTACTYLERCRHLNYRTEYCLRRQIKNYYLIKDYVAVNNFITEHREKLTPRRFFSILLGECLSFLGLGTEAEKVWNSLLQNGGISDALHRRLSRPLGDGGSNPYQKNYEANQDFFRKLGFVSEDYGQVRYKAFPYLSGELVYDGNIGGIISGVQSSKKCDLTLTPKDGLIVHDADGVGVFKRLQKILNEAKTAGNPSELAQIPVFIVERSREHWSLMMQLFDFNNFNEWTNMHFCIAPTDEELQNVFLDESAPIPNVIYGVEPDRIKRLLAEVLTIKNEIYRKRLEELAEYYQSQDIKEPHKVLLVSSITDNLLLHYGKAIQNYLNESGYTCLLHLESAPYYRFTSYADAKLVNDFRPDLVIHLFAVQEELEVFRELPVHFISWRITGRLIYANLKAFCVNQRVLFTGNLKTTAAFTNNGYSLAQDDFVPLPVTAGEHRAISDNRVNPISIIGDLDSPEDLFCNLATIILGMLPGSKPARADMESAVQSVYFSLLKEYFNHEQFDTLPDTIYQELIESNLKRYHVVLEVPKLQYIAYLFRRELEKMVFKILQARWAINSLKGCEIAIYGSGWDRDPAFRSFYRGNNTFLNDEDGFMQSVLGSKINLYIGNMMPNQSYFQPDLINGIAGGGFFMVNDLLVKEYGDTVLEPFAGLLITYGGKEEMLNKVEFYLDHEEERRQQAARLKEHVLQKFSLPRVVSLVLKKWEMTTKLIN